jgi:hypothetical protein
VDERGKCVARLDADEKGGDPGRQAGADDVKQEAGSEGA